MGQERQEDATHELAITKDEVAGAEKIVGLGFTDSERELMLKRLNDRFGNYEKLRSIKLDNSVPPALNFNPCPPGKAIPWAGGKKRPINMSRIPVPKVPSDPEDLAFLPLTYLSRLIQSRKVTSLELTKMYLERLKRYDPYLHCVVTLTEDLALAQAERADEEIERGHYRGPLHGVPWGAKDLLATKGIRTTWGAAPYKDQLIDTNATVVERLEEAGAVLVAKLTLGALASGDVWYGGQTRNPWDVDEGSSGSSAGVAAAVAGGLVGFAIGTETLGSIVSPCSRCGVTGLRPTYGRVSRHGAMALSWSMDKIGPICRTVEDCAVVFDVIKGPDGRDPTIVDAPFDWDPDIDVSKLRVGYVKSAFDEERDTKAYDDKTLETLRSIGVDLIPLELPDYPVRDIVFILGAEAAAAFDELTRSDRDDLLVRQDEKAWPNSFRAARFVPAVEYIQANRLRTLIIQDMAELMEGIDVYLTTRSDRKNPTLTNLTGHPTVVVPNG
ncbi:MAG: amidase, partial [Candidatus Bathyarchaeota archaeon]|nr:amidase [Candidatus Bathyarchaeota archaeon]